MHALASRSRRQALVVKVADGNKIAVQAATVAVLDQLGWLDARQREELRPWRAEAIANARGTQVGERRPAFTLKIER
jgi:L-asparaginase II